MGTLLALLVFLSIFGIFLTEYLPLWMTDNEEAFAVQVAGQFGQIDHTMDIQYLNQNNHFAASNPVTMTSDSIPVFSQPTYGTLDFGGTQPYPQSLYENIAFHQLDEAGWSNVNYSTGVVSMNLHDRYYVPLTYVLQDGAVLSIQNSSVQSVIFTPSVITNSSGTASTLDLTLFATYGNTSSATSTGTEEVFTQFVTSQYDQGTVGGTPVYMNFSTYFPCAWARYWNASFAALNNSGFPTHPSVVPGPGTVKACGTVSSSTPTKMRVYFPNIVNFNLNIAIFNVVIGTQSQP